MFPAHHRIGERPYSFGAQRSRVVAEIQFPHPAVKRGRGNIEHARGGALIASGFTERPADLLPAQDAQVVADIHVLNSEATFLFLPAAPLFTAGIFIAIYKSRPRLRCQRWQNPAQEMFRLRLVS